MEVRINQLEWDLILYIYSQTLIKTFKCHKLSEWQNEWVRHRKEIFKKIKIRKSIFLYSDKRALLFEVENFGKVQLMGFGELERTEFEGTPAFTAFFLAWYSYVGIILINILNFIDELKDLQGAGYKTWHKIAVRFWNSHLGVKI